MEEFQHKNNYLRHLKKIAEVKEGIGKPTIFQPFVSTSYTRSKEVLKIAMQSREVRERKPHTSTERIINNLLMEKQNVRLVSKILHMNSSISFKRYSKEYLQAKKYTWKQNKREPSKYIYIRFFDISFINLQKKDHLDQVLSVYRLENNKKILIHRSSLFEMRNQEIKLKKNGEISLKIECKNEQGLMQLGKGLVEIMHQGKKTGYAVIQYIKK